MIYNYQGRANTNDIKISDISISRSHAILKVQNGEVYIIDAKSKFGTLLLLRKPIEVKEGKTLSLQTGRTMMSFSIKSEACCCFEM